MNKSGYFFKKALPNTILFQKGKQAIGSKKIQNSVLQLYSSLVLLEKKKMKQLLFERAKILGVPRAKEHFKTGKCLLLWQFKIMDDSFFKAVFLSDLNRKTESVFSSLTMLHIIQNLR